MGTGAKQSRALAANHTLEEAFWNPFIRKAKEICTRVEPDKVGIPFAAQRQPSWDAGGSTCAVHSPTHSRLSEASHTSGGLRKVLWPPVSSIPPSLTRASDAPSAR